VPSNPNNPVSSVGDVKLVKTTDMGKCARVVNDNKVDAICQTHWEVWRFYGRKNDPARAYLSTPARNGFSVSRVNLVAAGECADFICPPGSTTRCPAELALSATDAVFFSPHPHDAGSLSAGSGVFDGGFNLFTNTLKEPVLFAPSNSKTTSGGAVFTTLEPFRKSGSCEGIVSDDSPLAGNDPSARGLRSDIVASLRNQGYGDSLARRIAGEDASGNWAPVACASPATFARPAEVLAASPAERPVYGACWVPVYRNFFAQASAVNGTVSYGYRPDSLFRYGAISRPDLAAVSAPVDDAEAFAEFIRNPGSGAVVVSVDYDGVSDSKTVYVAPTTRENSRLRVDVVKLAKSLWSQSYASSATYMKVSTPDPTDILKVSARTGSSLPSGLSHHAQWREAIRINVEDRWTGGAGSGIGNARGGESSLGSNPDWVPADPYPLDATGANHSTDRKPLVSVNRDAAARAASQNSFCVDGPLSSGDFEVGSSATSVSISGSATLPNTTVSNWGVVKDSCRPSSSGDPKQDDASRAACNAFKSLSPVEQERLLGFASTTKSAQARFEEYLAALAASSPSAKVPDLVSLPSVVSLVVDFPNAGPKQVSLRVDAEVKVDSDCPTTSLADCLKTAPKLRIFGSATLPNNKITGLDKGFSDGRVEGSCAQLSSSSADAAAAARACTAFKSLSPSAQMSLLKFPSTAAATQARFDTYLRTLFANPSATVPSEPVVFPSVVSLVVDFPNTGPQKVSLLVDAEIDVKWPCPAGSPLNKCPTTTTTTTTQPRTPRTDGETECPGPCYTGPLPDPVSSSGAGATAILTLVVPRNFVTGAGMSSVQRVEAVVHDLDTSAALDRCRAGGPGWTPASEAACRATSSDIAVRLKVASSRGYGEVALRSPSSAQLSCPVSALQRSFDSNYGSSGCSATYSMDFFRASEPGEGFATDVSASGTVSTTAVVMVPIPDACLSQVVPYIDALLGSAVSERCEFRAGENSTGTIPAPDPSQVTWLPSTQEHLVGTAGIKFTVRIVFKEDIANADAHDTLRSDCGPDRYVDGSPKTPGLEVSNCTLRPVVSSSATGKRQGR